MKVLLASVLLFGIFGVADSASCSGSDRVFMYPRFKRKSQNETQFVILTIYPADINETFIVKVDNAFVDGGKTTLQPRSRRSKTPRAKVKSVNEETGEFSLELTESGKQLLKSRIARDKEGKKSGERRRWWMEPDVMVGIAIVSSKKIDPKDPNGTPKFAEFQVGNFSCTGPKCKLPADGCAALFKSHYKNGWDMEEGTADLPITPSGRFKLKIGFETPIQALNVSCKLHFEGTNECRKVWRYENFDSDELAKIKYLIRVQPRQEIPPVSFIMYEDRYCKTICGTRPVCATPPPTEEPDDEWDEEPEANDMWDDVDGTNDWDEFEVNERIP